MVMLALVARAARDAAVQPRRFKGSALRHMPSGWTWPALLPRCDVVDQGWQTLPPLCAGLCAALASRCTKPCIEGAKNRCWCIQAAASVSAQGRACCSSATSGPSWK